ncbi:hypothetical protein SAMN05421736_103296 [Evansella caseinilytica]|uniref:Uncharacterized protein n=1 Tax=Evansella caseinilytica TaxID=1503961 RepID=A0A1H3MPV0_9BACI|nr:hypothetical protein SAMN05421736_103296 [Evansella caseinilytica]
MLFLTMHRMTGTALVWTMLHAGAFLIAKNNGSAHHTPQRPVNALAFRGENLSENRQKQSSIWQKTGSPPLRIWT